jgi:hypothetical protein
MPVFRNDHAPRKIESAISIQLKAIARSRAKAKTSRSKFIGGGRHGRSDRAEPGGDGASATRRSRSHRVLDRRLGSLSSGSPVLSAGQRFPVAAAPRSEALALRPGDLRARRRQRNPIRAHVDARIFDPPALSQREAAYSSRDATRFAGVSRTRGNQPIRRLQIALFLCRKNLEKSRSDNILRITNYPCTNRRFRVQVSRRFTPVSEAIRKLFHG